MRQLRQLRRNRALIIVVVRMKRNGNSWESVLVGIGCLPLAVSAYFLISCLVNAKTIYDKIADGNIKLLCLLFGALLYIVVYTLLVWILRLKEEYADKESLLMVQKEKFEKDLEKKFSEQELKIREGVRIKENELQRREEKVKGFVEALDKEKYCAELIADFKTVIYEEAQKWLRNKYYSAPVSAETVRQFQIKAKASIEELKEYKYKEEERISRIEDNAQQKINQACAQRNIMRNVLHSTTPFMEVAELYADSISLAYGEIAQRLREKIHPANTTADKIEQELRKKIREVTYEAKVLQYRWKFLISIYPEMEHYVNEDESLISMAEYESMASFNNNRDRAHDYLSDEEYNSLSDVEKYQLSLNRYKERPRANAWIAGVEYEMYCSYLLKQKGFTVVENGIIKKREDMGRDIIAYKNGNTYIIQCKRYSLQKKGGTNNYIHENVICQLYGTTIEYAISNPDNTLFAAQNKIIPVLCTTGKLSEMAEAFAERLHVKVIYRDMGEYPMIKCNINNVGERIYHLPFDQQYWNTRIEKPGEFYAWSVKEAEEARFRRAMKWTGNS